MELNDRSTPLNFLATRRSAKPRDLVAPGPDETELSQILGLAARTPDHGRLVPYRFVVVGADQREALAALFARALRSSDGEAPESKVTKAIANAAAAPVLVVLVSSPTENHKIPVWEQQLSCGAAGMNLLHAANAFGYVGGWITGWQAYDPEVTASFCRPGERIAGFIYIGTPANPLAERERPVAEAVVSRWVPPDNQ